MSTRFLIHFQADDQDYEKTTSIVMLHFFSCYVF